MMNAKSQFPLPTMLRLKTKKTGLWLLLTSALFISGCSIGQSSKTDPMINVLDREGGVIPDQTTSEPPSVTSICQEDSLVEQPGSNIFGVIEIGGSGVKGEVVQKLPSPSSNNSYDLEPRAEDIEPRDVDPINIKAQAATVSAVSDIVLEMQQRFSIPCEHITIYGSSGFSSKAEHADLLKNDVELATGRNVELISAEEEAIYVFNAVVPSHRLDDVVMIDIGSGNTKGAYLDGDHVSSPSKTFSIDFGTKSFTKVIDDARGATDFVSAAETFILNQLMPEVQNELNNSPNVTAKRRVYLAGGISWSLATLMRPCEGEQVISTDEELSSEFVQIFAEDVDAFYMNAAQNQENLFSPDLSGCNEEDAEAVKEDIQTIQEKVFTQNQLIGGAEILRTLSTEMDFASKDAIFFSRYAFEALPVGYLKQQLN